MSRDLALAGLLVTLSCGGEPAEDGQTGPGTAATSDLTQPLDADIWVADLTRSADGLLGLGTPRAAIARAGYDNQPSFLPDGSGFWFSATDTHSGQSDIWMYELATGRVEQIVMSAPESEYSATPIPGGEGISVIRVEADSTQRLWRFDLDGTHGEVLLEEPVPVGYHVWAGPRRLALFVLGELPTLQLTDLDSGTTEVVAEGIGRSLQPIPGSNDVSFTRMNAGGTATIMRLLVDSGETKPLVDAIEGGEFHAWTPDGRLLMGSGSKLFAWRPESTGGWREVADLAPERVRMTRLAVSPDGSHIAIVVEPGDIGLP